MSKKLQFFGAVILVFVLIFALISSCLYEPKPTVDTEPVSQYENTHETTQAEPLPDTGGIRLF